MKKTFIFLLLIVNILTAQSQSDSLLNLLETAGNENKAVILNKLAKAQLYISPDKTEEYATQALELADEYNNKEQKILALINIGNAHLFSGDFETVSEDYFEDALKLSRELNFIEGITSSLNSIASVYMNKGQYHEALDAFSESLKILKTTDNLERIATVQINIAGLYTNMGIFDKAIEYFLNSLSIFEQTGNKDLMTRSLNNIAVAYHSWGNYEKALEYYFKSLKMYEQKKDTLGTAVPLNNIGEIYKDKKKYGLALEYYLKSLEISEKSGNKHYIGVVSLGVGEAFKGIKDYEQGLKYSFKALDQFESIGLQEGTARAKSNIADIYREEGVYQKALKYLNESQVLAKESGIKDLMMINNKIFSDIYSSMGDHRKSLAYYKLYSATKDSIFTEENSQKIARMNSIYETEQKEKENELLRQKNEIQTLVIAKQESVRNYLVVISILILILLFSTFTRYKVNRKAKKILEVQNQDIASKNEELTTLNTRLEKALKDVKKLSGLLPICARCKNIRDDKGYWKQIESYIKEHSEADFSHSICPDCSRELYPEFYENKKETV